MSQTVTGDASLFVETPAASEGNFRFFAPKTASETFIGGSGFIYGNASVQAVYVENVPGMLFFDPSFNRGGDEVHLRGAAAQWQIQRVGSTICLTDGDTIVFVPFGDSPQGLAVAFTDGVRLLRYDTATGAVKLGEQVVDQALEPVLAAAQPYTFYEAFVGAAPARLFVSPGEAVTISGNLEYEVFGTAGSETIVFDGFRARFDPSFNRGGDTLVLPQSIEGFIAQREGSVVKLTRPGIELTLPVGTAGMEIAFEEGSRTLVYNEAAAEVRIGGQVIGFDPTALSVFA